ncbi:SDR family NAD(P)-dependent oxidoreductase [Mycolicibacterium arseniciresistens]|uniref:3-oxoacyl-[acyl-carrier-protein] reductase MabA n=1 Tax=Mycolicibacterium arseniciresistens TaxID=3062257 RepID=A0ABT8U8N8_9MYCO|nr:SDR family NAD(P)-dependent oxidoreductase [Mycolicibacterium arseniciresistens]MDO3634161.1 SDR family NAD(P)-dependent oxidoreductase [Mycolicibacterium arseniciresistens]
MRANRVAVVTGGASGMGEETCYELARRGHSVAVLDLNGQQADRVSVRIIDEGGSAVGIGVDVTHRPAVESAFERVRQALGPVAVLVTSAGKVAFAKFEDITADAWRDMLDVNLTGTFHCCQVALPDMVAARWGRIVMISSSSAQRGSPYMAHYAVSKGAVITLTKSLAAEYARKGITVNNIPPSSIDTPMARRSQSEGTLYSPEELAKRIPMGHMGTSADIAAAVCFLCSDEAGFITGQVLGVNGGAVM